MLSLLLGTLLFSPCLRAQDPFAPIASTAEGQANSDAPELFSLIKDEEVVTLPDCNDTSIYITCMRVKVNKDAILDNAVIEVALPDGTVVKRSGECNDGQRGENRHRCAHFNNDDHTASIYMSYSIVDGAMRGVTGDLHMPNGNVLALETDSGTEILAWINKDTLSSEKEEALYDDEDYEDEEMDRARAPKETPLLDRGKADSETMVEVSGYIDTCFEEANACLANSLVPLRLKHFGTKVYEGNERLFFQRGHKISDLNVLLKTWVGDAGKNTTTRNALLNTADTAVMLTSRSTPAGIGYYPPNNRDVVTKPFAIVNHMVARGLYAFLHELGHVMGASHELTSKTEWPANEIPYRHAFRFPSNSDLRQKYGIDGTIMRAIAGQDINYLSNPAVTYKGIPIGSATENNARVLTEGRFRASSVGDESATIIDMQPEASAIKCAGKESAHGSL